MREAFHTLSGALRSLRIYYGDRPRRGAMDTLYRRFLRPGDLAFDIGAHVGDRVASFRGSAPALSRSSRRADPLTVT